MLDLLGRPRKNLRRQIYFPVYLDRAAVPIHHLQGTGRWTLEGRRKRWKSREEDEKDRKELFDLVYICLSIRPGGVLYLAEMEGVDADPPCHPQAVSPLEYPSILSVRHTYSPANQVN